MKKNRLLIHRFRGDKRAISPAISTVILTNAIVVLLLVTIVFGNNFLTGRMAENEFEAVKQFMQTVGLQIDDVAWMIGRTQTVRYASKFGRVSFESCALNYTVYVDRGAGYIRLASNYTGIFMFNMPVEKYNIANDYHERVFPTSDRSFLQKGTSAPVSHVFVIEKVPMNDGNFVRIIVAPSLRMLNSTISTGGVNKTYFKLYLPVLTAGSNLGLSQSVTLTGCAVAVETQGTINKIKMHLDFPKSSLGFGADFFNFNATDEEAVVPSDSVVEFYTGEVRVSLGLHI